MTTQPEALRLADALIERHGVESFEGDAAAVLRRLHAENASISAALASSCDEQRHELWESGGIAGCERARVAERQRDALLEALKEYGWHHEGCPQYPTYTHPDRWPACTCGFDDAIKAVEGENHAKSL